MQWFPCTEGRVVEKARKPRPRAWLSCDPQGHVDEVSQHLGASVCSHPMNWESGGGFYDLSCSDVCALWTFAEHV